MIHILPSFHYDVAYLKTYAEYLPQCFRILDEALRILEADPEYRFLVEQVILLEEYWSRFPERREALRRFAREGRVAAAPGMYVMPDLNHTDGESLFRQAKIGKDWLRENLGLDPDVCWIADCWGHHAQLPQILRRCGYRYYVFWRCMRRDVMRNDFLWEGLDGTRIRTHWLARGYGNLHFPSAEAIVNAPDLDLAGCGPRQMEGLREELRAYGPADHVLLCNGGDFMLPQATAPEVIQRLRATPGLEHLRFSTPNDYLDALPWDDLPTFGGEFNSAFQGTFTSNVRIKQRNRALVNELLAVEALAVVSDRHREFDGIWRLLLKQQFHDIICGTITDAALRDAHAEFDAAAGDLAQARADLAPPDTVPAVFNPCSFARTEVFEWQGKRRRATLPPLGFAPSEAAQLPAAAAAQLPRTFENEYFRAEIGAQGYLTSLVEQRGGVELVRGAPPAFGGLGLQLDYGDLWLNFESPLSGGSLESALTQNHPDPYDRAKPNELVNRGTFPAQVAAARAFARGDEELEIEQEGILSFWRLRVAFVTRMRLAKHSARIEYETILTPTGRHYRVRAAFPTAIRDGAIRHEIPFGVQTRGEHEHVARNWADYGNAEAGLALLNAGTPASNVDGGTLLLTLFRAAAMEYKAPSAASFQEGVTHTFRYAVLPHPAGADVEIVRNGLAFNQPPLPCAVAPERLKACEWRVEGGPSVAVSGLRWSGDGVFVRVYECAGGAAEAALRVPARFTEFAPADGLERPSGAYAPCRGAIPLKLRAFEIQGVLLRAAKR